MLLSSNTNANKEVQDVEKLFIFDTRLGQREDNEHEKILFYYPASSQQDQQCSDVGLVEALINFTKTFSPDRPCNAVHTEQTRQAIWEPEPNLWVVIVVKTSRGTRKDADGFVDHDLSDEVLDSTLRNAYEMFVLFHGPFERVIKNESVDVLRRKLSLFFPPFIATIPPTTKLDLTYSLRGIRYFPVDRQQDFRCLKYGLCMFKDMLVWNSLPETSDLSSLYNYLVAHVSSDNTGLLKWRSQSVPPVKDPDAQMSNIASKMPMVFLNNQSQEDACECKLVVFRNNHALWCFLLDQSEGPISSFDSTLTSLESRSQIHAEEPYRKQGGGQKTFTLSKELQSLLLEMHSSLREGHGPWRLRAESKEGEDGEEEEQKGSSAVTEICVKTSTDGWVVGRRSNGRELFVISENKNSNLVEVNEEVERITGNYFSNIFM
ncbi:hypothetical protein GUITHDRAFT_143716 [Guillardia theta CCMP2712]|uniref:CCZ1/INTU/HSP4 first Longin domain-containing protein n=1 Tax=Guillardia theta (strain CCMP2712) TaxID=905079 RepID=L1ITE1_GUITC|nr:hypothetical protein GUITHDRAFT_143716 [Guillardia theta CCMP2712]EKX39105.1 hypothetical protein GUITHDRAFT_143716 [Guillardia theta CCMP2712]|eukprot:XP_005826085.1 hypothetical protein GUITHDRAFT_143716 [Guillardia theta CCMP2712]